MKKTEIPISPITKKTVLIGRTADNDVILDDPFVSRRHLSITRDTNGVITLQDLGSLNGTFVNGKKVITTTLSDIDIVKIGNTVLTWQDFLEGKLPAKADKNLQEQIKTKVDTTSTSKSITQKFFIGLGILALVAVVAYILYILLQMEPPQGRS
ncbi:MAG: FHA domain-containing protein [Bacteroidia bacterium]|nr:FHA domain-containing protein [Bacteroidia bacterium]